MYIPNSINITNATLVQAFQYSFSIPFYPYLLVLLVVGIVSVITKRITFGMIFGSIISYLLSNIYPNILTFSFMMFVITALVYGFELFIHKNNNDNGG